MRRTRNKRWCFLALGALVATGCGSGEEREPVYHVTGTVTLKGAPLSGAVVTFSPSEKGQPASGTTDASGKYQLGTWAKGDGAQAGQYKVSVAKYEAPPEPAAGGADAPAKADPSTYVLQEEYPEGYDEMAESAKETVSKNLLPEKYASPDTSGFEARVVEEEEKNVFDFKLE